MDGRLAARNRSVLSAERWDHWWQPMSSTLCLIPEAASPTLEEILDRAGGRAGGSVPFDVATDALREDRDRR